MIYQTICKNIDRVGTDAVLTEFESDKKYILKGILQPIDVNNRGYSQWEYTAHGSIDNSCYLFIFNTMENKIDYKNAILWVHNRYYFVKSCKTFYYCDKAPYMSAVLTPYNKE